MSLVPQASPSGLPVRTASPTQALDPGVVKDWSTARANTAPFDEGAVARLKERLAAVGLLDIVRQSGMFDKLKPDTTAEQVKEMLVPLLARLGAGNILTPEELLANRTRTSELTLETADQPRTGYRAAVEPSTPAFDDAPAGSVSLPSFDAPGLPRPLPTPSPSPRQESGGGRAPANAPPPSFVPFAGGIGEWGGLASAPTVAPVRDEGFGVPSIGGGKPPAAGPSAGEPVVGKPPAGTPAASNPPPPADAPADLGARLARLSALLDAPGRAALQRLQAAGRLAEVDTSGRTVLDNLEALAKGPLSEQATKLGYSAASVVREVVMDIDDPTQIRQDGTSDCVLTNLRVIMSRDNPGQYAAFARDLYLNGAAEVAEGATVKLQQALQPFDLGGNFGKSFYKDGQLMFDVNAGAGNQGVFTVEQILDKFLNSAHASGEPWIDRLLKSNPAFDNAFVRGLLDTAKGMWNRGERAAVIEFAKPYLSLFVDFKAGSDGEAASYLVDNMATALSGGAQAVDAVPAGLPLSKVGAYLPGLKAFGPAPSMNEIIKVGAMKGLQIPVAVRADNGNVLHLATVVGRTQEGAYMVYDPKGGLQVFDEGELMNRIEAVYLSDRLTHNLPPISSTDGRPVGGGVFRPQRRRA
ncbi:MAG: hypothetical protein VKO64_03675 [Candidatus Sericytochromatia bacterium]|nr:hypothetical protein [Candidatus Sericytochromatia bacterium]